MPRIVRTKGILGGEPRLDGHRISVLHVVDLYDEGRRDRSDVAEQLDISLSKVETALEYYENHPEEMTAIRDRHEELEEKLAEESLSPPDR